MGMAVNGQSPWVRSSLDGNFATKPRKFLFVEFLLQVSVRKPAGLT